MHTVIESCQCLCAFFVHRFTDPGTKPPKSEKEYAPRIEKRDKPEPFLGRRFDPEVLHVRRYHSRPYQEATSQIARIL
jgi:hypothetical protein